MEAKRTWTVAWGALALGVVLAACVVETEPGPKRRLLRDMVPPTPPSAMPLPPPLPPPPPALATRPADASTTDAHAPDARLPDVRAGNDGGR